MSPRRLLLRSTAAAATFAVLALGPLAASPASAAPSTPADIPDEYYATAAGKTGDALASALHDIISVQDTVTYSQLWDALARTDQDPDNPDNVILLYTGRSQPAAEHGGNLDQWNREHVWAKSHGDFGTATGPGTDLHHMRPSDVPTNNARGNKDFDDGGSPVEDAPGNYTDGDSFEPRDAVKGDIARMIFYMDVRYDGGDGFADLEVNDSVDNGSAPNIGRVSVLKEWSDEDPPDAFEEHRNDVIYEDYQHNRNPFVDHPEWVDAIW